MKQIMGILLAAALCILAGCAPAVVPGQQKTVRIGVTLYDQYDTFISELMGHFSEYAQEMEQWEGVTLTVMWDNADNNQTVQNNQVEGFIDAGCDVICVNLVDRTDAAVIIDMAEAANVPIVFFNRELVEEDLERSDQLYYVGAHALESGWMQGQIVVGLCDDGFDRVDKNGDGVLQYAMLEGQAEHQDAIMRTEYSIRALTGAGYPVERLEDEIANWMRAQAETKMAQWLSLHGDGIEVVLANNDDMALGAIDALKRAEIPSDRWPVVVGIDGTIAGLEAVALGEMAGTVLNDSRGQALGMLDICLALATGRELPELEGGKYLRLPYQIVTPDNVLEFIADK